MNFLWRLMVGISMSYPALVSAQVASSQTNASQDTSIRQYKEWYLHLHTHPETGGLEKETAAYLKTKVSKWGYAITDSLGMQSFAAVLKNGKGPVILYRTDMDALPLMEQTGLPYASQIPAMHACGHDIHMSSWLGIAEFFGKNKKLWSGTLVLLAQSAEELGQGAKRVVASPAFKTLPRPDIQLAIHDHAELPAGEPGFCDGYSMAAVDMMNITVFGKGGHGAQPQNAIDPVLLAAQYVQSIQSIVSRNLPQDDPAVITIGAIHGGTVGNIIPDQVELRLTIRSFSEQARALIFRRLKTIGNNLASAAGLDSTRWPQYNLLDMSIPSVYNDPALGERLRGIVRSGFGDNKLHRVKPIMIGEDFGVYGRLEPHIPSYILWMGTVSPEKISNAGKGLLELPSLHSPRFAPDYEKTIPGAVSVMCETLLKLFSQTTHPSK